MASKRSSEEKWSVVFSVSTENRHLALEENNKGCVVTQWSSGDRLK